MMSSVTDEGERMPAHQQRPRSPSWPVASALVAAVVTGLVILLSWLSGDSVTWWQAALAFVGFYLLWLAVPSMWRFFHAPNGE